MAHDDRTTTDEPPIARGLAHDDAEAAEHGIETERGVDDPSPQADEALGGIDGAPQAAGWAGPSGGLGATGAMGGAGAGGAAGATDPTLEGGDATAGADPGAARTEFEMGHEGNPEETSKI
jgi:hypothetical protein